MNLSEFDFPFEQNLIASYPVEPRDQARLLVIDRRAGSLTHRRVADLPELLCLGDLVVANDTKVLPARLRACNVETGRVLDLLFVRPVDDECWEVMLKGRVRVGQQFSLGADATATVLSRDEVRTIVRIESRRPFHAVMHEIGTMPLPPYIKRSPEPADREWYQTTFAKKEGAIAAPTAGLHLTDRLRRRLGEKGIKWAEVTLHVGPGTFKPINASRIEDHRMEQERVIVPGSAAESVQAVHRDGGRVVAVGTTVVRALESCVDEQGEVVPTSGETSLYIIPGYRFRAVDVLLTNFHLPKTTLAVLVSAFAGVEFMREAYRVAVQERYRFYSYGDAMLVF